MDCITDNNASQQLGGVMRDYPDTRFKGLDRVLGQDEAHLLVYFHYWDKRASVEKHGRRWQWRTYKELHITVLPHLSTRTIERRLKALRDLGVVIVEYDRQNHRLLVALNYPAIASLKDSARRKTEEAGGKWHKTHFPSWPELLTSPESTLDGGTTGVDGGTPRVGEGGHLPNCQVAHDNLADGTGQNGSSNIRNNLIHQEFTQTSTDHAHMGTSPQADDAFALAQAVVGEMVNAGWGNALTAQPGLDQAIHSLLQRHRADGKPIGYIQAVARSIRSFFIDQDEAFHLIYSNESVICELLEMFEEGWYDREPAIIHSIIYAIKQLLNKWSQYANTGINAILGFALRQHCRSLAVVKPLLPKKVHGLRPRPYPLDEAEREITELAPSAIQAWLLYKSSVIEYSNGTEVYEDKLGGSLRGILDYTIGVGLSETALAYGLLKALEHEATSICYVINAAVNYHDNQ